MLVVSIGLCVYRDMCGERVCMEMSVGCVYMAVCL